MEKEFVPFELSVKLKEIEFDEPCLALYKRDGSELATLDYIDYDRLKGSKNSELTGYWYNTAAPIWQQVFDWFREKYNLSYCVAFNGSESYYWWITECKEFGVDVNSIDELDFETYEEARKACLEKLIQLVEDENTEVK